MVNVIQALQYYTAKKRRQELVQYLNHVRERLNLIKNGTLQQHSNCTQNIYATLKNMLNNNCDFTQPLFVTNNNGNILQLNRLDAKMAMSLLSDGLVRLYNGAVFPTSLVDLQYDEVLIQNRIARYDTDLAPWDAVLPTFNESELPLVNLLYQSIISKQLYFGKRAQDNSCQDYKPRDVPETTPTPQLDQIPEWQLLAEKTRILGNGQFGIAFYVFDAIRCRPYVVKICKQPPEPGINEPQPYREAKLRAIEQFFREVDIAERLRRRDGDLAPGLTAQYGFHYMSRDASGKPLQTKFVMLISEFIPQHPTITKWLKLSENTYDAAELTETSQLVAPAFTIEQIMHITIQLTMACHRLHQLHIVHRDVKHTNFLTVDIPSIPNPNNLPLPSIIIVKLIDYGLSKIVAPTQTNNGVELVTNTDVGSATFQCPSMGTGAYNGRWSDLIACGIVALHLIFGYSPGFYAFFLKNNRRISSKAEVMDIRGRMSFADYIHEYDLWRKSHPYIQQLIKKPNDELTNFEKSLVEDRAALLNQHSDFAAALQTLFYHGENIQNRELWFTSKFFVENVGYVEQQLNIYKELVK